MAKAKGSSGVVVVGAATVAGVRRFTLDSSMEPINDSDLGTTDLTFVAGDIQHTATVECFWDKADAGQNALTIGAQVTLVLKPDDGEEGVALTQTMTALVTGIGQANEKQNMVTKNVTFQISGEITTA